MGLGSLSPRVSLEQSRKQAKDLLKAFKAGDAQALDRIRSNHPRFRAYDVVKYLLDRGCGRGCRDRLDRAP